VRSRLYESQPNLPGMRYMLRRLLTPLLFRDAGCSRFCSCQSHTEQQGSTSSIFKWLILIRLEKGTHLLGKQIAGFLLNR